jgi:hypothetical protein
MNDELSRIRDAYDNAVNSHGTNHENSRRLDDAMEKGKILRF